MPKRALISGSCYRRRHLPSERSAELLDPLEGLNREFSGRDEDESSDAVASSHFRSLFLKNHERKVKGVLFVNSSIERFLAQIVPILREL